ncbi:hypothetical protein L915_08729, partial [Phytophthora nicotianae]
MRSREVRSFQNLPTYQQTTRIKSHYSRKKMALSCQVSFERLLHDAHDPAEQTEFLDEAKPKRRRCTYAARREEAKRLREELHGLESEVAVLKYRSGHGPDGDPRLKQAELEIAQLSHSGREKHLQIAKAQSAMSRCLLNNLIHSTLAFASQKNWDQRRAKLVSIREEKLRNAYDFVMDPRHYVDPAKAQYSDERFETAQGDFCGVRFETVQFPGVKSLQQVYDAA